MGLSPRTVCNARDVFIKELEEDSLTPLIIKTYEVHQIGDMAMVLHVDDVPKLSFRELACEKRHS